MRKISNIIIHCADTPNGDNSFTAAEIDKWHKQNGWQMIGYHFVIDVSGKLEKGRKVEMIGAHCKGENEHSIGICMIGRDKFTFAQWSTLFELLHDLKADYRDATVHGHREFAAKSCPGWDVKEFMNHVI